MNNKGLAMMGFSAGVLTSLIILVFVVSLPSSLVSKYHDVINACEYELPRNQTCEIYAKPSKDK